MGVSNGCQAVVGYRLALVRPPMRLREDATSCCLAVNMAEARS